MQKVLDVFGNQHKPGTHTGWVKSLLSWPAHKSPSSDSVCRNPLFLLSTLHTRVLTAQPSVWPLIYWPSSWDSYAFCCSSQLSYNRFSKIVSHGFYFFSDSSWKPALIQALNPKMSLCKDNLGELLSSLCPPGNPGTDFNTLYLWSRSAYTRSHMEGRKDRVYPPQTGQEESIWTQI